jgi:hypothetical protein
MNFWYFWSTFEKFKYWPIFTKANSLHLTFSFIIEESVILKAHNSSFRPHHFLKESRISCLLSEFSSSVFAMENWWLSMNLHQLAIFLSLSSSFFVLTQRTHSTLFCCSPIYVWLNFKEIPYRFSYPRTHFLWWHVAMTFIAIDGNKKSLVTIMRI